MNEARLKTLLEMVEQEPDDDFSRYGLALEYKKLERFDQAHEHFDELLRRHADYVPGYFMSAQMYAEQGDLEAAQERIRNGIAAAQRTGDQHALAEMTEFLDSISF